MIRKIVAVWVSLAMLFGFVVIVDVVTDITLPVRAATLYVNTTGLGGAYTNIQDAIDASSNGDTVFVYNGTYYENVVIDKSIFLIGEGREKTTIDSGGNSNVIYVTGNYVNIKGFSIKNGGNTGIRLESSSNNVIEHNNISDNNYGMYLHVDSNYNTIRYNNIFSNWMWNIEVFQSSHNNISSNNLFNTANADGIRFEYSQNNDIINNNITSNRGSGIKVMYSSYHNIIGNNISANGRYGINLVSSPNINISNNNFVNDSILIEGSQLSHYDTHSIPDNNLVNNKPIYYYKDKNNIDLDGIPVGELILANCTCFNLKNLQLSKADVGMQAAYTKYINISNCNISWINEYGIHIRSSSNISIIRNNLSNIWMGINLWSSNNNNISSNDILLNGRSAIYLSESSFNNITNNNISNNDYGVYLYIDMVASASNNIFTQNIFSNNVCGIMIDSMFPSTTSNLFYHNNFINNSNQARDWSGGNIWDNGYPSGGNYWSDYSGVDNFKGPNQDQLGSDGIGDTNYSFDFNSVDNYPLMGPYKPPQNYTILKQGWNLISIPLIQVEGNLTRVLDSIDGYYDAVQWYDITDLSDLWKHYRPGKPFGNDLFELNETLGFWIHITQPGDTIFLYNGTQPAVNQSITLHPGWNMVGYPSLSNRTRDNALNNIIFYPDVDAVWTFNAATQTWQEIGPGDSFELGRGYWVHSRVTKTWDVPL